MLYIDHPYHSLFGFVHEVVHGDFRYSTTFQRRLLQVYSLLCHHMLDHYKGGVVWPGFNLDQNMIAQSDSVWWFFVAFQGGQSNLSQHLEHHLHTNDFHKDPDWTVFAVGRNWIRRHPCNSWQPYNPWQVSRTLEISKIWGNKIPKGAFLKAIFFGILGTVGTFNDYLAAFIRCKRLVAKKESFVRFSTGFQRDVLWNQWPKLETNFEWLNSEQTSLEHHFHLMRLRKF